jgi:hypothetical protein
VKKQKKKEKKSFFCFSRLRRVRAPVGRNAPCWCFLAKKSMNDWRTLALGQFVPLNVSAGMLILR